MRTISLFMKKYSRIPLEFDNILPELLYDKDVAEIENTIIYRGNKEEPLSNYFAVSSDGGCTEPSFCTIVIDGNLNRVKYIGTNMSCGNIIANSDVDLQAGSQMSGGHIIVNGDAESYAGREMTGGVLEINGNAREFLGSSYAGEWRGMSGGKIIVQKNVGKQAGECMAGGEIHIKGNCDALLGIHMTGGFIQVEGDVSDLPAGQMKKGTIVVEGKVHNLLEGFIKQEKIQNPRINDKYHIGTYGLYLGDAASKGRGQLWIKE